MPNPHPVFGRMTQVYLQALFRGFCGLQRQNLGRRAGPQGTDHDFKKLDKEQESQATKHVHTKQTE